MIGVPKKKKRSKEEKTNKKYLGEIYAILLILIAILGYVNKEGTNKS